MGIYQVRLEDSGERSYRDKVRKIREATRILKKTYRFFLAITLTFKDEEAFESFQKEGGIRKFLNSLVNHYVWKTKKRSIAYIWVLERQKRGVPHYHILVGHNEYLEFPLPDKWVFKYGMTNIKRLRFLNSNYLCKYLIEEKEYQTIREREGFFKKLRVFGISSRAKDYMYQLRFGFRKMLERITGLSYKCSSYVRKSILFVEKVWVYGEYSGYLEFSGEDFYERVLPVMRWMLLEKMV